MEEGSLPFPTRTALVRSAGLRATGAAADLTFLSYVICRLSLGDCRWRFVICCLLFVDCDLSIVNCDLAIDDCDLSTVGCDL